MYKCISIHADENVNLRVRVAADMSLSLTLQYLFSFIFSLYFSLAVDAVGGMCIKFYAQGGCEIDEGNL